MSSADNPDADERDRRQQNYPELVAFLKPIMVGDLDACGPLADWLDEHGDTRGMLLRKRWRQWQAARLQAKADAEKRAKEMEDYWRDTLPKPSAKVVVYSAITVTPDTRVVERIDHKMKRYIRERFPESWPAKSDDD